ncbi:unnamed protein product [Closterium sp. NIES-53]
MFIMDRVTTRGDDNADPEAPASTDKGAKSAGMAAEDDDPDDAGTDTDADDDIKADGSAAAGVSGSGGTAATCWSLSARPSEPGRATAGAAASPGAGAVAKPAAGPTPGPAAELAAEPAAAVTAPSPSPSTPDTSQHTAGLKQLTS